MRTFLVPPENAQYSVKPGTAVAEVQLDGGVARRRKDIIGASSIVKVMWIFNRSQYLYFWAFYKTELCEGALPFQIELILDTPLPVLHTAWIVADTAQTSEQKGLMYKVTAELEVQPIPIPDTFYTDYLDAFETDPETAWALYLATLP